MDDPLPILAGVAAVAAFFYFAVVAAGTASIKAIRRGTLRRLPDESAQPLAEQAGASVSVDWLDEQGFDFVGAFKLDGAGTAPLLVVWKHVASRIYLVVYILPNGTQFIDIVSVLDEDTGVTTSTTKDGHLMPGRQGTYKQSFSGLSVPQLWQRHLEAEQYVASQHGLKPGDTERPFEEELMTAVHKQIDYVTSLPLWPLRIPWWYFVRRNVRHNRPIAPQEA